MKKFLSISRNLKKITKLYHFLKISTKLYQLLQIRNKLRLKKLEDQFNIFEKNKNQICN